MSRNRESVPDYSSVMGVGHINTTGFLFGDEDEKPAPKKESATSPDVKSYLQMNATDDKFPILVRRDAFPGVVSSQILVYIMTYGNGYMQLSASSAALDLALSQSPGPDSQSNGWTPFARHRPSQPSLPQNVFDTQQPGQHNGDSPNSSSLENSSDSPIIARQVNRRSMEATLASYAQKSMLTLKPTNGTKLARPTLAKIQSSYSTNDIPTLKNPNGILATISPPKSQAQQQFHNHNASLGRIPAHAVNHRHSREMSGGDVRREEQTNGYKQQSDLHANAAPFGPSMSTASQADTITGTMSPLNNQQFASPAYYGGYGMQMLNMGMTPIQMNNAMGFQNQMSGYQPQSPFTAYSPYGHPVRYPDSQARVMQQRRMQNVEGV